MREICSRCGKNPRAINYKKEDKIYYRKLCDSCIIDNKKKSKPLWQKQGYKKKLRCESCDFIPKYPEQLAVCDHKSSWYTFCLNCEVYVRISNKLMKKGDLKSDF